jgi:hypothetical protein
MFGSRITLDIPYHVNATSPIVGTLVRSSVACNTPGFSFFGGMPALPLTLSGDPQVFITVTLVFDSLSSGYTGSFDFTEHFDHFP